MIDSDPPERTGSGRGGELADPKGKRTAPPVAVYVPPSPGEAHPKISRLGAAQRLDEAEAALNAANVELVAARSALQSAEHDEGDCLAALTRVLPGPTPDEVNRERLARIQSDMQARADQGLSPIPPKVPTHGHSPIDKQAAERMRAAHGLISNPLRSATVRRTV